MMMGAAQRCAAFFHDSLRGGWRPHARSGRLRQPIATICLGHPAAPDAATNPPSLAMSGAIRASVLKSRRFSGMR